MNQDNKPLYAHDERPFRHAASLWEEGRGADGGGFEGRRGHGGHKGRRSKRFSGDELQLLVLGMLEQAPQNGYQLLRSFSDNSGGVYSPSPGVLYPLLTLLQEREFISEMPGEGRRRAVMVTETGQRLLDQERERLKQAMARLAVMGEERNRADAAPIRRAMMNLRTAVIQRMSIQQADEETAFSIAALLDATTQQIERL